MAGWGGAEGPETPITGKEEAGGRRAIGVRPSEDPPPCVTSLSSANFQATGGGREETLGRPGKLYHLKGGAASLGAGSGGRSLERVSLATEALCVGLQGEQEPRLRGNWPPEPRVLQTVLLSKLWHSSGLEVTADVTYGAVMVAGWGREWSWRTEDTLSHSSDAPTFVQHEGIYHVGQS